jgi:DNA polymerase III epsilon subunit-like protein
MEIETPYILKEHLKLEPADEREIVFFDLETTVPPTDIIEFASITLDGSTLLEKGRFSLLIYSDLITVRSTSVNHITERMVEGAPSFSRIADQIHEILDGKIWAGHNIKSFDIPVLFRKFEQVGFKAPKPALVFDTLWFLKKRFPSPDGHSLATLGRNLGLGEESHRALDDVEMNINVLARAFPQLVLGL